MTPKILNFNGGMKPLEKAKNQHTMLKLLVFFMLPSLFMLHLIGSFNGIKTNYKAFNYITESSTNWRGEYFNNTNLSGRPVLVRDDGSGFIDFDWGLRSPDPRVYNDFSARWTRTVYFRAGTYRFTMGADDGMRLKIDGVVKKEDWRHAPLRFHEVDVTLSEGYHTIVFEFFDDAAHAIAKLSWKRIY
jgi:hypothetical protein